MEIRSVLEHALFLIATDDNVVEGAGEFDAGLAGHETGIANNAGIVNITALQA